MTIQEFKQRLEDLGFLTYRDFLSSQYWFDVNVAYDKSRHPKYCWICFDEDYQLHHEDYGIVGFEMVNGNLGKLIPVCDECHHDIHWDENNERVPIKEEFLRERRLMLRKKYIQDSLRPTRIIPFMREIVYRMLW